MVRDLVPDALWERVVPLLPQAGEEVARAGKEAAARTERMKQRTPRVDLRRVAEEDVEHRKDRSPLGRSGREQSGR